MVVEGIVEVVVEGFGEEGLEGWRDDEVVDGAVEGDEAGWGCLWKNPRWWWWWWWSFESFDEEVGAIEGAASLPSSTFSTMTHGALEVEEAESSLLFDFFPASKVTVLLLLVSILLLFELFALLLVWSIGSSCSETFSSLKDVEFEDGEDEGDG